MKFLVLCCIILATASQINGRAADYQFDQKTRKSTVDNDVLKFDRSNAETCGYQSCNVGKPGMLNVHMVPHTHDDVGWLVTVDQYYYNAVQYILDNVITELRNDPKKRFIYVEIAFFARWWREQHDMLRHIVKGLVNEEVQYILDNAIAALDDDPNRRFIYVEVAYFKRWWDEQHDYIHHRVKNLVNEGRLEFILGAWSMNDEAATHYNAIIDQHTLGFQFLMDNFGECGRPRIGWQIDPFGHSREQASLFAQFGFDGLFFGRLDYQDKDKRMKSKTPELMWLGSDNLGDQAALFTGVNYNGYGAPGGFCFDAGCGDPGIQDDDRLHDFNVKERVTDFLKAVNEQAKNYTTNNIMLTMGSDFQYTNAHKNFKNMDKLIEIINEQAKNYSTNHIMLTMGGDFQFQNAHKNFKNFDKLIQYVNEQQSKGSKVNLFYSTPSCYAYAINKENQTYTAKTDDFFPYASRAHTFWTGYFTSRPALKGYVRMTNNFLQVCKQLDVLAHLEKEYGSDLKIEVLREAMGVNQHHDAVSGTEKQAVAYDYAMRLAQGVQECQDVVNYAFGKLLPKGSAKAPVQEFCPLLNVSYCSTSEDNKEFTVTVYNPIGRKLTSLIRLPVSGSEYGVQTADGKSIPVQIVPVSPETMVVPEHKGSKAKNELVFLADLPAMGFNTYFVFMTGGAYPHESNKLNIPPLQADMTIKNEYLQLTFDAGTGLLKQVENLKKSITVPVQQMLMYYKSYKGDNHNSTTQASGAYIFRPNGTDALGIAKAVQTRVVQGPLVQEVHQVYGDWASQVFRLHSGQEHVEMEYTVGPIPFKDGIGKEVISRFVTNLATDKTFYTDANGREVLKRVRDYRSTWTLNQTEPISGNYYPVNSRIYIRDEAKNLQLTVLNDRSQGGSSIRDGELELMVHRRMLYDDSFGVGEPLNETGISGKGLVVRGKHYIFLDDIKSSGPLHRDLGEKLFMAPQITLAPLTMTAQQYNSNFNTMWSGLRDVSLPPNVHLLTLEQWNANTFLIRLEHFYEKEEDPVLSLPAKVSIKSLFRPFDVASAEELTLGANEKLSDAKRLQWNVKGYGTTTADMSSYVTPLDASMTVELKPMQIRTFQITVSHKS